MTQSNEDYETEVPQTDDIDGFPLPRRCLNCGTRPTYRVDGDRICKECGWSKDTGSDR